MSFFGVRADAHISKSLQSRCLGPLHLACWLGPAAAHLVRPLLMLPYQPDDMHAVPGSVLLAKRPSWTCAQDADAADQKLRDKMATHKHTGEYMASS